MKTNYFIKRSISVLLMITLILGSSLIFAKNNDTTENSIKIRNLCSDNFKNHKAVKSSTSFVVSDDEVSYSKVKDNTITMIDGDSFNQSSDEDKLKLKTELKKDFNNHKTIMVYIQPDGKKSSNDINKMLDINGFSSIAKDEVARENEKRLVAYSLTLKEDGSQVANRFYAEPGSDITDINKHMNFIIDSYNKSLGRRVSIGNQIDTKAGLSTQSVTSSPMYTDTRNYNFGTSGDNACGSFQMTTYVDRAAKYSDYSLWDVKGSNTTTSAYHSSSSFYITDYLCTRYSVEGYNAESVIQNGLNTTNNGNSASVSLTAGYKSGEAGVGYSTSFNDVDCIADYRPLNGYARWEFDYYRGIINIPNAAAYSYTTEPAARFKNTTGAFYVDLSSVATYWSKWDGSTQQKQTGVYSLIYHDR